MYHVHPFSHACSTSNTLHKDYIKKDGLSSLISDFKTFFQRFFILSPFSNTVHFEETDTSAGTRSTTTSSGRLKIRGSRFRHSPRLTIMTVSPSS